MKNSILIIAGFAMPGKRIVTVTDINEKNLNSDPDFFPVLFRTKIL